MPLVGDIIIAGVGGEAEPIGLEISMTKSCKGDILP